VSSLNKTKKSLKNYHKAAIKTYKNPPIKTRKMLFPYNKIRPFQAEMMSAIENALKERKFLLIHAPTGLGKTAGALAPAIEYALANKKTIFFLTSRHTQQNVVFETVKKINETQGTDLQVTGIIGKRQMCAQPNVEQLSSNDFTEYCKALITDKACTFYENSKKKVVKEFIEPQVRNKKPDELIRICKSHYLCPYEISIQAAKSALIIISDYYYIFNKHIRNAALGKMKKELKDSIIIIDEAHNLPQRLRKLLSRQLTNKMLSFARKEAQKYGQEKIMPALDKLTEELNKISEKLNKEEERIIKKREIELKDAEDIADELEEAAKIVLVDKKRTVLNTIANFLKNWKEDEGYSRILKKETDDTIILKHNCIDPALLTKEVFDEAHAVIAMSGTLQPLDMYADVLGFPKDTVKKEYPSPFPDKNKLVIIFPRTTTKFSKRDEKQYDNIAKVTAAMANAIPGKTAIFFPSYHLRDSVLKYFEEYYENSIYLEQSKTTKEEKEKLLEKFKKTKKAALLGAATGSFGEGIDMPGVLKGVIIVGLPLQKPDLETQQKIQYYDDKFGKGWDYGYVLPAMTTSFQNAGRCIRTEKDKGVLIFVDERFSWPNYFKTFPKDWNIKITGNPIGLIDEFFQEG